MPQTPGPKGVEFPTLHALQRWPGAAAPSFHPGVRAGAGWWSWGPRADGLLFSPPFSFFLPITVLFSLVRSFGFIRSLSTYILTFSRQIIGQDLLQTFLSSSTSHSVLLSKSLWIFFFHFRFFLYICKSAQTFMKGIIYTQRWAPWFIPENHSIRLLNS